MTEITEQMINAFLEEEPIAPIHIHGGDGFDNLFDISMVIEGLRPNYDLLADRYRQDRERLWKLQREHDRLKNKWYVRLMTKIERLWMQ